MKRLAADWTAAEAAGTGERNEREAASKEQTTKKEKQSKAATKKQTFLRERELTKIIGQTDLRARRTDLLGAGRGEERSERETGRTTKSSAVKLRRRRGQRGRQGRADERDGEPCTGGIGSDRRRGQCALWELVDHIAR
jgi:hypothetical protein